jgi:ABC-type nitrate/sulfonate/bicarbonate transport system substrate-binding protein
MRSLVAGFMGCFLAASSAQADQITIGHMSVINQNEFVAEQLGLYKKNGLDVQIKLFQTGPSAIQGLLSGDLQAVEAGGSPMLNLASQNVPVYFLVSGGMNTPNNHAGAIMVRPGDTTIKSFADLKDKKLGTLPKGTITNLWISNAAAHYGMARSDIVEVSVPFPQMGGLLASGQVDAVYDWPPYITMVEQAGQGRVLVDDSGWNPYAVLNALIVRQDWADAHPDLVRRLVRASIEANRWIDDHPNEAREVIGKNLGLSQAVYEKMAMFYFPRNGYQVMPSIWDYYYLMIKSGEMQPLANPTDVVQKYWYEPAKKFIDPVVTEMGRQDDPVIHDLLKTKLPNLDGPISDYLGPWEQ